ncbi:LemA protein [Celerinatantimonas diazotrophica]|uniref:LemA protein n=2 Tax=Celerinatantimonas diazotrophica TaxID=412034 RepID=A0A4R1KAM0_9GAMM|nr:LemA protein [Celerinatantimonas diazotrophica]CAG9295139.1 Protein LemA [Celerinatantimonas diazotrophica]
MNPSMASVIIIAVLIVIFIFYGISIYNHLVNLKNNVARAWANIDVLLKQRHDEIPKLVETCKQYMGYEQGTFEQVMQARSGVYQASDAGDVKAVGVAESELRNGLGKLFALAEAYPDLHANDSFANLQQRISTLESSISDRREFYNDSVNLLNTRIEQFPHVLIARRFGFKSAEMLSFSQEQTRDVDLKSLFN